MDKKEYSKEEKFLAEAVIEHYKNCPIELQPDFAKGYGSIWDLVVKTMESHSKSTVSSAGKGVHRDTLQIVLDYMKNNISASIVYEDFYDFSKGVKGAEVDYIPESVEELAKEMGLTLANQFKATPAKVITDQEIESAIKFAGYVSTSCAEKYFTIGAKWYREQLNQK